MKTTVALDCVTLAVGQAVGATAGTWAPSCSGIILLGYTKTAFDAANNANKLPELAEKVGNSYLYDMLPLVPVAQGVATTVKRYNHNAAGGTNHP